MPPFKLLLILPHILCGVNFWLKGISFNQKLKKVTTSFYSSLKERKISNT